MTRAELKANVDTIVVVIMENRSFDHVLGHLRHSMYGNRRDIDGIEDLANPDYINPNIDGQAVAPFWMDDRSFDCDLPHDSGPIASQLRYSAVTGKFAMNGFVHAFEEQVHTSVSDPPVMGLLTPGSIPATGALAAQYTVCNRWFACIPTSTVPNRLMSMCGRTDLGETGIVVPDQQTVYDWLLERGVSWRVYAAGLPFFTLMPRLSLHLLRPHFRRLDQLKKDLEQEPATDWPNVIFIEPDYYDCPLHFRPPCDNHPPLGMAPGEAFLAEVYTVLSGDERRWSRTVFILTYDEHGGFFDHVPPLPVKYRNLQKAISFDSTGPRVPAIVAGPFAPRGVSNAFLDNTSILQLIAERFGKAGETYSAEVAGRMQQKIESVSAVLSLAARNSKPCDLSAVISHSIGGPAPSATVASRLREGFDRAVTDFVVKHRAEAFAKYPELRRYGDVSVSPRALTESVAAPPAAAKVSAPVPKKGRPSAPKKRGARKRRRAPTIRRPKGK